MEELRWCWLEKEREKGGARWWREKGVMVLVGGLSRYGAGLVITGTRGEIR